MSAHLQQFVDTKPVISHKTSVHVQPSLWRQYQVLLIRLQRSPVVLVETKLDILDETSGHVQLKLDPLFLIPN